MFILNLASFRQCQSEVILLCACLLEEVALYRSKEAEVGCHYYLAEAKAKPMQTAEQLFEDSSLQQGNLDEGPWPVMSKLILRVSVTARYKISA